MEVYGQTDIGKVREINQDTFSCGYLRNNSIFAVICDGMGGQKSGNIASKLACNIIDRYIKENYRSRLNEEQIKTVLVDATKLANYEIYKLSAANSEYAGMGTTMISAIVSKNIMSIAHVGDSRVYIQSDDTLLQVTRDHSIVQLLLEQGKISKNEVKNHPQKNIITRAVGTSENVDVDYINLDISNISKILLCTDGLTNFCEPDQILDIIKYNQIESACHKLINCANNAGGKDNITVVILSKN